MKKSILAIILVIYVIFVAGCGGGGGASTGGSNGGGADEPVACTDSIWTPDPATVPMGVAFTQTSNCGTTRQALGTKDYWLERAGNSEATLFKSLAGTLQDVVISENNGALFLLGRDSASKNNKGKLCRITADGTVTQLATIDSPLNTTFVPYKVVGDATHIVAMYKRLDGQGNASFNRQGYLADGSFFFGENNVGYGLQQASMVLEGNKLFTSRIAPETPLPAPYPFSVTQITNQDLVTSGLDVTVEPAVTPWMMSVDSTGIYVNDGLHIMQYDRNFNVLQPPTTWSSSSNSVIHDMKSYGDKTYVVGSEGGNLRISQIGNPAFRNTKVISLGTDMARLGFDASGNMYVSAGNRIGRVDKTTGEITTLVPPAIPPNVPWYISGSKIYFLVSGTDIHSMPLSEIP